MSAAGDELFRLAGTAGSDLACGAERRRWRVEIPAGSPLFAGHFPGHPILPGIAQLAIVERALGEAVVGVRSLKLRRPVGPGDALDLWISSADLAGWVRFELRRGDEAISGGAVATPSVSGWEQSAYGAWADGPAAPVPSQPFPAIEALLPHANPARLVREVIAASSEEIVCAAEIPLLYPLTVGGRTPAWVGIEAAAQAAAALETLNRPGPAPGPRIGYVVGIRAVRLAVSHLPAGQPLRVRARREGSAPPLSIYEVVVDAVSPGVVTGTISTFLAEPTRGE